MISGCASNDQIFPPIPFLFIVRLNFLNYFNYMDIIPALAPLLLSNLIRFAAILPNEPLFSDTRTPDPSSF
jgi:hypothetical protein